MEQTQTNRGILPTTDDAGNNRFVFILQKSQEPTMIYPVSANELGILRCIVMKLMLLLGQQTVPIGDAVISSVDTVFGSEICEEVSKNDLLLNSRRYSHL